MQIITLANDELEVKLSNIGATIVSIKFDNAQMVLSPDDLNYYKTNEAFLGTIVGRTAGRIKYGQFYLNNKMYQLPKNFLNQHNLHGNELHQKMYDYKVDKNSVTFTYIDKEGVYPGKLEVKITYILKGNQLECIIEAIPDKDTIVNMTNHTYFNLNMNKSVLDQEILIPANEVWYLDKDSLPLKSVDVTNTPFDFRKQVKLGKQKVQHEQFDKVGFIDHPFKLDNSKDIILYDPDTKRKLLITTNQEFVVCYSGNYLAQENFTFDNKKLFKHQAICFEPQALPNAINTTAVENHTIIKANEKYENKISYRFEKERNE